MGLPSLGQVAPSHGTLKAISYLGFCTTKTEEGWVLRNSRSYAKVEGLGPYNDFRDAQDIADHLNWELKLKEMDLLG